MTVLPQGEAASVAAKDATQEANREVAKGAEPIWFASYPAGVPRTIDPDRFPSLSTMLIEACRQHAARPAFESLGARMTYAEWERDSKDFAAFLIEQLGCRRGVSSNSPCCSRPASGGRANAMKTRAQAPVT